MLNQLEILDLENGRNGLCWNLSQKKWEVGKCPKFLVGKCPKKKQIVGKCPKQNQDAGKCPKLKVGKCPKKNGLLENVLSNVLSQFQAF